MTALSRVVLFLANLLLWGYAADACVTVLDVAVGTWWESPLTLLRSVIANLVMNTALLWLLVLIVFGSLLKRWSLFWLAVSALWLNAGGQPIGLYFDDGSFDAYGLALGLTQLLISIATLLQVRRQCGVWLLNVSALAGEPFRLTRWVGRGFVKAAALAVLFLGYQPLYLLALLEQASAGYLQFTWSGAHLRDEEFIDDGNHTIRLVAMAHVGEPIAYQRILASFAQPDTIILAEGITDKNGLLGASPRTGHGASRPRLISVQPPMTEVTGAREIQHIGARTPWVNVMNADLDTAELSPDTLEWTRDYVRLLSRARSVSGLPLELLFEELSAPISDAVWREILYSRNQHLLDTLQQVQGHFTQIIVPWGALHMPGIAEGVQALGYRPNNHRTRHTLLRWSTLLHALRSNPGVTDSLTANELKTLADRSIQAIRLTRRPALKLLPADPSSSLAEVGHFGGLSTRYAGERWPVNPESGVPMGFVAELHATPTTAAFFGQIRRIRIFVDYSGYDGSDDPAAYRIWVERVDDPDREPIPWIEEELAPLALEVEVAGDDYGAALIWPARELVAVEALSFDRQPLSVTPYGLSREQSPTWWALQEEALNPLISEQPDFYEDGSFIGGHPQWIQDAEPQEQPFFLQLYPPDEMGWGDGGIFCLFIDRDDPGPVVLIGQSG